MYCFVAGQALTRSLPKPVISTRSTFSGNAVRMTLGKRSSAPKAQMLNVFTNAMEEWKKDFPGFASRGWGATTKAEIWNGRHAMFGMLVLWITAYCKAHGLIPEPEKLLDLKQWGTLADLGGSKPISNERAIILIAHVHVILVSVAAAIAPFSFQDKLLLEPGEKDPEPAGLIPPMKLGLTREAEIWNGRLAMLGVMVLSLAAATTGTPLLDVMNKMFGSVFY